MMLEDLEFEYVGEDLTATIDHEKKTKSVSKIVKFNTQIFNNNNLDTILGAPINVDLFLGYIDSDEEINAIHQGTVTLTLSSLSGQTVYYKKNINFVNGIIKTQFANILPLGEYLLKIEYLGNKYFKEASTTIQFSIESRIIRCVFDDNIVQGFPDEIVNVGVTLLDYLNDKKIGNCAINYSFNNYDYTTYTNEYGYAILSFKMPSINSSVCLETLDINDEEEEYSIEIDDNVLFFDDNGMIKYTNPNRTEFKYDDNNDYIPVFNKEDIPMGYENENTTIQNYTLVPKYPLEIDVDSTIYRFFSEQSITVLLKQYSTKISYNTLIDDTTLNIVGNVTGKGNDAVNVEYGVVSFNIAEIDPHPYKEVTIDENGHFDFNVKITQVENSNVTPTLPTLYSTPLETETNINIIGNTTVSRNYVKKNKISFKANVKTIGSEEIVKYGMVTFIIMRNYEEIYRYITELNNNGEAYFNFDVSTIGDYQVKAEYYSVFEYKSSKSDTKTYKIIEDE